MTLSSRLRHIVGALLLGAAYYCLVVFVDGYLSAIPLHKSWFDAFPTRRIGVVTLVELLNTSAMCIAALPVALAARFFFGPSASALSAAASLFAVAVAVIPSLGSEVWPLIHGASLVYFVVDNLKMILILPLITWVLDKLPSNYRRERTGER